MRRAELNRLARAPLGEAGIPRAGSAFDTVPLPRIVPAPNARVFVMCATRSKNEKCISGPASGSPTSAPLSQVESGRCTRPSFHAWPSSSGVSANGENAVEGLLWKKPKPFASSSGIRFRRVTSFARRTSRTCAWASSARVPCGVSPRTTQTSDSKSQPHAGSASSIGSKGPRSVLEPPW